MRDHTLEDGDPIDVTSGGDAYALASKSCVGVQLFLFVSVWTSDICTAHHSSFAGTTHTHTTRAQHAQSVHVSFGGSGGKNRWHVLSTTNHAAHYNVKLDEPRWFQHAFGPISQNHSSTNQGKVGRALVTDAVLVRRYDAALPDVIAECFQRVWEERGWVDLELVKEVCTW